MKIKLIAALLAGAGAATYGGVTMLSDDAPPTEPIAQFRLTNDNGTLRVERAGGTAGAHAVGAIGLINGELQFEVWTRQGDLRGAIYALPAGTESNVHAEATAAVQHAMETHARALRLERAVWIREDTDLWWSMPPVRALLESIPCGRYAFRL